MSTKTVILPEIPSDRRYWFFRTEAGLYYADFMLNNYIAFGWDKFSDINDLNSTISDASKEILKGKFSEAYPDEQRSGLAVNQILTFINIMKIGDAVLIPSAGGENLSIGIIESDPYIKEIEDPNSDDFLDDRDRGYSTCSYLKRRKVKWVCTIKKNNLDPHLFKLMCARNAISDASSYDMYIDRNIHPIYVKNGKINVALRVEQENGISTISMSRLLYGSLKLIDCFDFPNKQEELDDFEVKMMVESPGVIHFIGGAAAISILLGGIATFVYGANVEFVVLEQKYSIHTGGCLDQIKETHRHEEAMQQEQNRHEEAMTQAIEIKKSLEEMKVHVPKEL